MRPITALIVIAASVTITACGGRAVGDDPARSPDPAAESSSGPRVFTSPESAAEAYIRALCAQDATAAMPAIVIAEREGFAFDPTTDPNWEAGGQTRTFVSAVESIRSDSLAVITVTWTVGGVEEDVDLYLVIEDDSWRVTQDTSRHAGLIAQSGE